MNIIIIIIIIIIIMMIIILVLLQIEWLLMKLSACVLCVESASCRWSGTLLETNSSAPSKSSKSLI